MAEDSQQRPVGQLHGVAVANVTAAASAASGTPGVILRLKHDVVLTGVPVQTYM